ncbi:MAG: hypothetical protein COY47_02590 [Chloroflexi bacterium CG_4_10_14_0_8_um_filter_57_5]|nr:MAG: hypothetical protein COY47_02590 [Chloroflexi bacterium CG_4_10_14_0_8_um_filter_57_5]PJH75232.1 MAG: hypothetical protein CO064_07755 [Anaerolineae bacterium CG_4_9_14_0_8_um_filter_58_9]
MVEKMKSDIAERNITLLGQLMEYLLDHPKVFDVLPDDFELVILPEDDPEIVLYNLELLKRHGRQDKPIVLARVKSSAEKITSQPSIFVPVAA